MLHEYRGVIPGMSDPIERNREALEALAEYGQTQLADDARALLEEHDRDAGQTNGSTDDDE